MVARKKQRDSKWSAKLNAKQTAESRTQMGRSRLTNGSLIVIGRNSWARRLRDLVRIYETELGGTDNCTAAERAIIRRVATLQSELEKLEFRFSENGEATSPRDRIRLQRRGRDQDARPRGNLSATGFFQPGVPEPPWDKVNSSLSHLQ